MDGKRPPLKSTFREGSVKEEVFSQSQVTVEPRFELEVRSDVTEEKAEKNDLELLELREQRRTD
jgi:hypothetical protein